MPGVFLASDHHFMHKNIIVYTNKDGSRLRPFDSVEDHDETLVKNHNAVVGPRDKVYFLGDVAIPKKGLAHISRLNGDKVLISGNHDIFGHKAYLEAGFRTLRAYHVMNGMILSHVPVHESQTVRFGVNIHGHTHGNRVMKPRGVNAKTGEVLVGNDIDPRYHCVSMEHINFTPILFEDCMKKIEAEGGHVGFKNGNY